MGCEDDRERLGKTEEMTAEKNKNVRVVVDSDGLTCGGDVFERGSKEENFFLKKMRQMFGNTEKKEFF